MYQPLFTVSPLLAPPKKPLLAHLYIRSYCIVREIFCRIDKALPFYWWFTNCARVTKMKHQFALLLLSALLSKPILAIGGYANGNSIFEIFAEKDDVITDNDAFSSSPFFDRGPPPHQEAARMARYIVHNSGEFEDIFCGVRKHLYFYLCWRCISDWTSMATISSRDPIRSFPFANVFSVSDGADLESSCGVPYLYLTQLEMSVKDLKEARKKILPLLVLLLLLLLLELLLRLVVLVMIPLLALALFMVLLLWWW